VRYLAEPASPLREAAVLRSRLFRLSDPALAALARDLGRVLRGAAAPASAVTLAGDDAAMLAQARAAVRRWLPQVDRVPPADLIDHVLRESAYAFELRGPRLDQARENVKKFRALVRRIQNRGYATMGRLAAHVDRLSVGDESNAAIDAVNAVNLMTVHASKGLEFPVVFVVNLARGTGGGGGAIRVVAEDGHGDPAVSIGTLRFESDEEEKLRDREETKRLLYVALTRARDRLYLATTLGAGGRFRPMAGSLAEVWPASAGPLFERAAAGGAAELEWTAASGRVHRFRCCGHGAAAALDAPLPQVVRTSLLAPVEAVADLVVGSVRARVQPAPPPLAGRRWPGEGDEVIAGRLVHRLFQRVPAGDADTLPQADLTAHAEALLRREERETAAAPAEIVELACLTWRALARKAHQAGLFEGEVAHEVPFTLFENEDGRARAVRGVIDCLVRTAEGTLRVVEIKTGRRAPWHEQQVRLYVRAAQALAPGAEVSGVLLTPDDPVAELTPDAP
jgi:ATP-dependent helicase/nuclease subunit A